MILLFFAFYKQQQQQQIISKETKNESQSERYAKCKNIK